MRRWEDTAQANPADPVGEASLEDGEDSLKAVPLVGDVAEVAVDKGLRIARARPADDEDVTVGAGIHQKWEPCSVRHWVQSDDFQSLGIDDGWIWKSLDEQEVEETVL